MSDAPQLMTIAQAAEWLGVSIGYLNTLRRKGEGAPFLKLGIRIYYDQADLTAWLQTLKRRNNQGITLWGAAAVKHGATVVSPPILVKKGGTA